MARSRSGPGRCFPVFPKVDTPYGQALTGLRVLKFDGAIAPRVLRFDAPPARGLWWAPYIYRRRPLMIKPNNRAFARGKTIQLPCGRRKCNPPLVASAVSQSPACISCHMTQKGESRNADFISIARGNPQPSARRAVKLTNPPAVRPVHLKNPFPQPFSSTFLHNLPPTGGHNPRGAAPSTY